MPGEPEGERVTNERGLIISMKNGELTLPGNRNQCQAINVLKVAKVGGYQRQIPLTRSGGNPRVGSGDRSPHSTAFRHDFGPHRARRFVREQSCTKIDMQFQLPSSRRAPLIQTRPQQEFAATHERHEPLVATRERPARLVENVIGLEEYRHDIRVEQQQQTH